MKVKVRKQDSGITLIALVITIIVLLILAGVTIATLTGENGILNQAGNAKEKTGKATALEKVQVEVLGSYGTNGKIELITLNDNLKNNIPDLTYNGSEISEDIFGDDRNRIEKLPATVVVDGVKVVIKEGGNTAIVEIPEGLSVGDTVSYTPEDVMYPWLAKYSGDSSDSTLDNTTDNYKVTSWRVFNINEDGTVDLIATQPTTGTVYLGSAQGYNNAVKLLNDSCNTLYGNTAKGISGRSINIEDIEGKMTEEALNGINGAYKYYNGTATYGKQIGSAYTSSKNYPSIYAQENLSVINGNKNTNGLGMSEQKTFIEPTDGGATRGKVTNATSIQPYQTFWWNKDPSFMQNAFQGEGNGTSNVNYNLIMSKETSTTYWVASRCVDVNSNFCVFRVRYINSGCVHGYYLDYSTSDGSGISLSICPVISLNSSLLKGSHTDGWRIE